jgi:hypothetical protein
MGSAHPDGGDLAKIELEVEIAATGVDLIASG